MIEVGSKVIKKSKKPFKSGNQTEIAKSLSKNEVDPKKRDCVVFEDGSVCNLDMIESC